MATVWQLGCSDGHSVAVRLFRWPQFATQAQTAVQVATPWQSGLEYKGEPKPKDVTKKLGTYFHLQVLYKMS